MTMLDLRGVTAPITGSDVAIGFDPNDGTVNAGRRSTWATVLELLGIHIQFAQSASGPWSSSSTDATHFRIATGVTQPGDSSARWTAAIPLGQGTLSFGDITGMIADNQIPTGITRDTEYMAAIAAFQTAAQVTALINAAGHASQADLDALEARVAALEGGGPTPHTMTRYSALRPSGAMPADFTEADFLGAGATTSTTRDIYTPASNDDMVVGIAVPSSEGTVTAIQEIDSNGDPNPFGLTRADFLPNLGDSDVTLDISGEQHYVYCLDIALLAIFLGVIGFRITQA